MTAIRINPMVVSVSPTGTSQIHRISPTQHGGGAKKVLAVVAAVVIPIAAPAIASSLVASTAIGAAATATFGATATAVASSAIVGAGLGAISAKVTGGDVKAGAIAGAIGGGLGGYGSAKAGTFGTPAGGISGTADRVLGTNFSGAEAATPTTTPTADGLQQASLDSTLSTTPPGTETLVNDPTQATLQNATFTPSGSDVSAQLSNPAGAPVQNAVVQVTGDAAVDAATKASLGERFVSGMKTAGSAVVNKLTDPEALANLTMQAGAQLVGAALAPDPEMPPEQRELLEMRKAELADLKNRDEAAFNTQMEAAKQYLQQAKQFDPRYMAIQAANKSAIEQQRKLREQERKYALSSGRDISAAERRRMSLDAARNVSSDYDKGFMQGVEGQTKITQAGLSAIPDSSKFATYTNALNNLTDDVRETENKIYQQNKGKNIADLFAGFNIDQGDIDAVKAQQKKKKAGLTTNNNFGTIAV